MSADRIAYLSVADFLDDENSGLVSRAYEAALHACARRTSRPSRVLIVVAPTAVSPAWSGMSFLTGRGPQTTRVLTSSPYFRGYHPHAQAWRTLPEHLKLSGWMTVGMGKVSPARS